MEAASSLRPSAAESVGTSVPGRSKSFTATKEQYANAISSHASSSQEEFLFTGVNYRPLSQFLSPPVQSSGVSSSTTNNTTEPWPFVVVHTYGVAGKVSKNIFDDTTKAETFLSANPASSECSHLLFMRGFPSSDWLNTLGALYKLNPEFIRRHLDFLQYPTCFDLPALPSSSNHFVDLKITTIGVRSSSLGLSDVQTARQNELEAVRKYQNQVGLNKEIGDSIIRKFSNHDETNFTLEQNISCHVKVHNGGFVVFIWLDMGRSLEDCPDGPWKQPMRYTPASRRHSRNFTATSQNFYMPIIQHRRKGPLKPVNSNLDTAESSRVLSASPSAFQNVNLLSTNYGSTLDAEAAQTSPLYALSEVFSFAAHSESQFLNLIQTQITREMREYDHELGYSIENLRYHRDLLQDHIAHISDVLNLVRNRGDSGWMTTKEPPNLIAEVLTDMQRDYESLLFRAKALVARCNNGCKIIMENATLEESRKSRSQAAVYGRLTTLAFFFVPLSFVTGLFGMNFVEFGSGNRSIWLFAVVLVPLLACSTVLAFPRLVGFKAKKMGQG